MQVKNLIFLLPFLMFFSSCVREGCEKRCRSQEIVDQVYVHRYGLKVPKNDWEKRGKGGKVVTTLRDGVRVTENYAEGLLDGEVSYTFPHSETIEKTEKYQKGILVGETLFDFSGLPQKEIKYLSQEQMVITEWYDKDRIKSKEWIQNDRLVRGEYYVKEGKLESLVEKGEGLKVHRDSYGQLTAHEEIKAGVVVLKTLFYPTGTPKEIIPFVNGEISGVRKTFFLEGSPQSVEEWVAGKQEGTTFLYQNGERIAQISFHEGVKEGVELHYREGKYIVEEISWLQGKRHGARTLYFDEGAQVEWYRDGKLISKGEFDRLSMPHLR